jgi:hypothetical protein
LDETDALKVAQQISLENTQIFVRYPDSVLCLLDLLEEDDFSIRFNVIELLTALLSNDPPLVQQKILEASQGVTKLVDLLKDRREVIRNETILLLTAFVRNCVEAQKILAFENIFELMFDIVESSIQQAEAQREVNEVVDNQRGEESTRKPVGNVETEILVHDCLLLLLSLLQHNESNQKYFRETGCIPRMNVLLDLKGIEVSSVSAQRGDNLALALELTLTLVDDSLKSTELQQNKTLCATSGVLKAIIHIALAPFPDNLCIICVRAFQCWRLLIKNHKENRSYACSLSVLDPQNRVPIGCVVAAFDICCTDNSPAVRLAAFELVQSCLMEDLYDSNNFIKALEMRNENLELDSSNTYNYHMQALSLSLIDTVVGWPEEADTAAVFYACRLLSILLSMLDSSRQYLLGTTVGPGREPLLVKCMRCLSRAERNRGNASLKIGILILVSTWLASSREAVEMFLNSAMHLPLLIEIITRNSQDDDDIHVQGLAALILAVCLGKESQSKDVLISVIRQRIGVTNFVAKLDEVRASDMFVVAYTSEHYLSPDSLLKSSLASPDEKLGHRYWYDSMFVQRFNEVYFSLQKQILELVVASDEKNVTEERFSQNERWNQFQQKGTGEDFSNAEAYKSIIREQDKQIEKQRQRLEELDKIVGELQQELDARPKVAIEASRRELEERNAQLESTNLQLKDALNRITELENLLNEKESDLLAISRACTELETENEKLRAKTTADTTIREENEPSGGSFGKNIIGNIICFLKMQLGNHPSQQTSLNEDGTMKEEQPPKDKRDLVSRLTQENGLLERRVEELLTAVGDWENYCEILKQNLKEEREQNERLRNIARDSEMMKLQYKTYGIPLLDRAENVRATETQQVEQETEAQHLCSSSGFHSKVSLSSEQSLPSSRVQADFIQCVKNIVKDRIESLVAVEEQHWKQLESLLTHYDVRLGRLSKAAVSLKNKRQWADIITEQSKPMKVHNVQEQQEESSDLFGAKKTSSVSFISSSKDDLLSAEDYFDVVGIQNEYQEALAYIEELQQKNSNIAKMVSYYMMQCKQQYDALENAAFSRLQLQIDLLDEFISKLSKSAQKLKI